MTETAWTPYDKGNFSSASSAKLKGKNVCIKTINIPNSDDLSAEAQVTLKFRV